MERRNFLKTGMLAGGAAMFGGLPAPALSQGAAARTLRFVPQANLANFDPIWGTQYVVRNAAALVWDTLYGFDDQPRPLVRPRRDGPDAEGHHRRAGGGR
jgi:peptide/nickel transport system substrate-binding protein